MEKEKWEGRGGLQRKDGGREGGREEMEGLREEKIKSGKKYKYHRSGFNCKVLIVRKFLIIAFTQC